MPRTSGSVPFPPSVGYGGMTGVGWGVGVAGAGVPPGGGSVGSGGSVNSGTGVSTSATPGAGLGSVSAKVSSRNASVARIVLPATRCGMPT